MNDLEKNTSNLKLKMHNTLSGKIEEITPMNCSNPEFSIYSCGPTVYDFAHIGNFRTFLTSDLLRRTLEATGAKVNHMMNITDVGHMTEDQNADGAGVDKMIAASKRLLESKKSATLPLDVNINPKDPFAIADYYAERFVADAKSLGLKIALELKEKPWTMPRATQMISEIIISIEKLIQKGQAYKASDNSIYFSVTSFEHYGKLSGNSLSQLQSGKGGRVDETTQLTKKHPGDFLLWKPDTSHLMKWDSPWGEGYPGWHIECSVMALEKLANANGLIDIHTGGEDLIFPHHECEIAQACGLTGNNSFARYWCHTRHLFVNGEKMSKSKGNFYTLQDLMREGASPSAIRLALLQTHYRSNGNFTWQGLKDSSRQIHKLKTHQKNLSKISFQEKKVVNEGPLAKAWPEFISCLLDDLNISGGLGVLNKALKKPIPTDSALALGDLKALSLFDSILGVLNLNEKNINQTLNKKEIDSLIKKRACARAKKNYHEADEVRKTLESMGVEIEDGPNGTSWRPIITP